ncbi:3-oxoacyl-[acyl-carrier protein] reductase [Rhizobiales bacterium GAS191]|nr:3-oxoacyl-[acyl-carrier protein] reductase [Rhizobiales bacterium GAS191]
MARGTKSARALPEALSLEGRRVLVTGAASGIGCATAHCLARLGADLVLSDRDPLDAVRGELTALGAAPAASQGDLRDDGCLHRLIESGPYYAFASVAGVFRGSAPTEAFDHVMHVNVRAPLMLASAVLDQMNPEVGGRIVLVGSSAGRTAGGRIGTQEEYAIYAASKGAIHTLVKALSHRAAARNVLINGVAPGVVLTPLLDAVAPELKTRRSANPLGRNAVPDEVAWPIALLCTPAASFISGAILDVNGGAFVAA